MQPALYVPTRSRHDPSFPLLWPLHKRFLSYVCRSASVNQNTISIFFEKNRHVLWCYVYYYSLQTYYRFV